MTKQVILNTIKLAQEQLGYYKKALTKEEKKEEVNEVKEDKKDFDRSDITAVLTLALTKAGMVFKNDEEIRYLNQNGIFNSLLYIDSESALLEHLILVLEVFNDDKSCPLPAQVYVWLNYKNALNYLDGFTTEFTLTSNNMEYLKQYYAEYSQYMEKLKLKMNFHYVDKLGDLDVATINSYWEDAPFMARLLTNRYVVATTHYEELGVTKYKVWSRDTGIKTYVEQELVQHKVEVV